MSAPSHLVWSDMRFNIQYITEAQEDLRNHLSYFLSCVMMELAELNELNLLCF